MSPFEFVRDAVEGFVRSLLMLGLLFALVAGALYYFTEQESPAQLLVQANPGWTVREEADGRPTRFDDGSGRGEVALSLEELGPHRIERVDCDVVRAAWPTWFAMPDVPLGNCVRVHDVDPPTLVMNVRTPMRISQIWDRHFEPLLEREQVTWTGGRSGRFPSGAETDVPAGQQAPEETGSASYGIDPRAGGDDRSVRVAAWRHAGVTDLVITFWREPPS